MSKSKSSTSAQTNNTNVALSDIDGIGIAGDKNAVNILDGGAIKNSFDFAKKANSSAFDFAERVNGRALTRSAEATNKALSYTQQVVKSSNERNNEQLLNIGLYLGLGALVIIGLRYVR